MKYRILSFLFCFSLLVQSFAQEAGLLIQNVNYIDVELGRSKKGDVLIQGDRIKTISADRITTQAKQLINGEGKWLMPGMVDAHIHLFQSGGIYTRPDVIDLRKIRPYEEERTWGKEHAADLLKRYLQCGITTVVDVGGPLYNFDLRDQLNDQTAYPNLFLTGPLVSTYQPAAFQIDDPPIVKVNNQEEAIALVKKQLPYQPDFIKIWYIALPTQTAESTYDIVKATIDESHANGLKVAVHATQLNTAKLALKAGADILVHSVDDTIDEEFITMVQESKVVYVPTLVVHGNYVEAFSREPVLTPEDFRRADPYTLGSLFDPLHLPKGNIFERYSAFLGPMKNRLKVQDSTRLANLGRIGKTPILVATGTDAGNIGTLHASSYFEELKMMKAAGLSNADILKASTINGVKLLGKEKELGSIAQGKMADLLLLDSNPLEDLAALQDLALVIKGGKPMAQDTIVPITPADLVQQQLNGYNAGDIEAFLAPYSDEVAIYNFPQKISGKGKDNIRPQYESMFKRLPNLHCELVNRMVMGNTVIDHERITGIPNQKSFEAIAIYKIKNNKIEEVYFIQ